MTQSARGWHTCALRRKLFPVWREQTKRNLYLLQTAAALALTSVLLSGAGDKNEWLEFSTCVLPYTRVVKGRMRPWSIQAVVKCGRNRFEVGGVGGQEIKPSSRLLAALQLIHLGSDEIVDHFINARREVQISQQHSTRFVPIEERKDHFNI